MLCVVWWGFGLFDEFLILFYFVWVKPLHTFLPLHLLAYVPRFLVPEQQATYQRKQYNAVNTSADEIMSSF